MKLNEYIPSWLKNKYLITSVAFLVWMLFFDRNDFLTQRHRTKEYKELLQNKRYNLSQIAAERNELELLKSNPGTLEKYAREKYLMKRDNEDLFIIPEKENGNK